MNAIESAIRDTLSASGWALMAPHGLGPLFAQPRDISPVYILTGVHRRPAGYSMVSGGFSVLCDAFEREWVAQLNGTKNEHALFLHAANVAELGYAAAIDTSKDLRDQVHVFCSRLEIVLGSMPNTLQALQAAFLGQPIAGRSVEKFRNFRQPFKYEQLREFVMSRA